MGSWRVVTMSMLREEGDRRSYAGTCLYWRPRRLPGSIMGLIGVGRAHVSVKRERMRVMKVKKVGNIMIDGVDVEGACSRVVWWACRCRG
jgi:hypothetical protein